MSEGERYRVLVCRGVSCTGFFADDVFRALRKEVDKKGLQERALVERGGCFGGCGGGVTVIVRPRLPEDVDDEFGAYEDTICAPLAGAEATCVAGLPAEDESVLAQQVVYPEIMEPDVPRLVREHLVLGRAVEELRVARRGAKPIR